FEAKRGIETAAIEIGVEQHDLALVGELEIGVAGPADRERARVLRQRAAGRGHDRLVAGWIARRSRKGGVGVERVDRARIGEGSGLSCRRECECRGRSEQCVFHGLPPYLEILRRHGRACHRKSGNPTCGTSYERNSGKPSCDAIHVLLPKRKTWMPVIRRKDVHARTECGHDGREVYEAHSEPTSSRTSSPSPR